MISFECGLFVMIGNKSFFVFEIVLVEFREWVLELIYYIGLLVNFE